jgi:hypothetical protein
MQNFEKLIEQIELNYNLNEITNFSISYVDHVYFKHFLPKKCYRKYFLVISYSNTIIEKKTIHFQNKNDYKRAIFRLNYLLETKYK